MPFGFKPLDQLLDDLIRKYNISPEDIIALERLTMLEKCRSCYDYLRGECDPNAEVLSLR